MGGFLLNQGVDLFLMHGHFFFHVTLGAETPRVLLQDTNMLVTSFCPRFSADERHTR